MKISGEALPFLIKFLNMNIQKSFDNTDAQKMKNLLFFSFEISHTKTGVMYSSDATGISDGRKERKLRSPLVVICAGRAFLERNALPEYDSIIY